MDKNKKKLIQVSVKTEDYEMLRKIAYDRHTTVNRLIVQLACEKARRIKRE